MFIQYVQNHEIIHLELNLAGITQLCNMVIYSVSQQCNVCVWSVTIDVTLCMSNGLKIQSVTTTFCHMGVLKGD